MFHMKHGGRKTGDRRFGVVLDAYPDETALLPLSHTFSV